MAGRACLVTGAGGFIGSHLVKHLLQSGAKVRAFIRYTSRGARGWWDDDADLARQIEFVLGDVRDRSSVDRAVAGTDVVFHLAALIGIPYSYEAPDAYVATNVTGTLNVLDAALRHDVSRVVVTSTSEVYGTAQTVPITEDHPIHPQSPYAASKAAADHLAMAFHLSFAAPVVILRPFNTYGPRQSLRAVIPAIAAQLLAGGRVRIGATYPTRDFTFVTDTVDAFIRAAATPGVQGRSIQVGTGSEISIEQLIERIASIIGRPFELERDTDRVRPAASEVERLVADASLARQLIGWSPSVSLELGLARTVEWLRTNAPSGHALEYQR